MTATTELVVPKSMPIIFAMLFENLPTRAVAVRLRKVRPMRFAARFVSTVILLNFSVLLSSAAGPPSPQILVAAAADLHPLQTALTKSSPIQVVFTFAASGTLAQQIRHGAPYDVYLSANERFVKELADAGLLLRQPVRVYA